MDFPVTLLNKEQLTHDVVRLTLQRPPSYAFIAGQAIDFKLNRPEVKDKVSAFTFTGLSTYEHLELTIKCYPDRHGMTEQVARLKAGDEVIISAPFDTVALKGPGVFIAGGTGVTPFIAILRQMRVDGTLMGNSLFFFNKTRADLFMEEEFRSMLGDAFHPVLSNEEVPGYLHGRVGAAFLSAHIKDFNQPFYTCGPEGFVKAVKSSLLELGAGESMIDVQF
ncbi:MAG TPA: FAD-binding oxidoreductase [Flavobacteriales bacterium]|nr:flavodoxin reductase [Flavobacteriales bacterium]HNI03437.1 FAD-binding oxidoreductase [Flavobacteriales bacterium]HNK42875.1 FAD-binding oxidoreductase [Flavobacteriales bacterium]HNK69399.1 FAD-binding oxidoreductase [Flavobacteriales bacterium]HNK84172.1 FAD-binding oxidoreductase [Flavobacteriales bacterium]